MVTFALAAIGLALAAMPAAAQTARYDGWEPDAPWRAAAAERIDRIRKADLRILVRDASGNPAPGAAVEVRMRRHAFGFGTAVAADQLLGSSTDSQKYGDAIRELFNKAVLENDLKWPQWESNRQRALNALRWMREYNIPVRGHNLVWPGWRWLPADLQKLRDDPEALRARVLSHIAEEAAAVAGLVGEWDVINEPFSNHDLQDILGNAEMAQWFLKAREADPDPRLYINDYSILSAGGLDRRHQDAYYATIEYLDNLGAPVEGIGMQGHFNQNLTPPARLLEILDRFARFSKAIQITEFDIDIADEQLQADYTRDFLTTVFSHPAVDGFLMWGFWEGRHWKPRGAMIRRDWSGKPNLAVWKDLVLNQWWTNADGVTGEDGSYSVRAFQGEYTVEVTLAGRSQTAQASLGAEGRELTIQMQ